MKKLIIGALATFFLLAAVSNSSYAQASAKKKTAVKVEGKAVEKDRGANPNIKTERSTVDKPESKSRGTTCSVYFDNYTGLYIDIYVDGNYKGELSPYGSGTVNVGDGYTTIYCISAGKTREWNASGNCDGAYTYKLY